MTKETQLILKRDLLEIIHISNEKEDNLSAKIQC